MQLFWDDKMEELEEIVAGWIGTLKVAVLEREALVSGEVQRAEQLTESSGRRSVRWKRSLRVQRRSFTQRKRGNKTFL